MLNRLLTYLAAAALTCCVWPTWAAPKELGSTFLFKLPLESIQMNNLHQNGVYRIENSPYLMFELDTEVRYLLFLVLVVIAGLLLLSARYLWLKINVLNMQKQMLLHKAHPTSEISLPEIKIQTNIDEQMSTMVTEDVLSGSEDNQKDVNFLRTVSTHIHNNISDVNFHVDELARELGMSRTSLYNRLSGATNTSVGDYIKTIRLEKAKELLISGSHTVSEVASMVGFKDRSHFSTSFSKYYDAPPIMYLKSKQHVG